MKIEDLPYEEQGVFWDWTDPKTLTTDQLIWFLTYEHCNHNVGHDYPNGIQVVDAVYAEIARRLKEK